MKPTLTAVLLAATPFTAHAAEPALTNPGDTLLTLTAEGKVTRIPDVAALSAGVATTGVTAAEAMAANATAMSRAIAALAQAGVADRDIQTSNLSLSPTYADRSRPGADPDAPPRITGYQASNTVSVRLRDITKTGAVIDALVAAGANQIEGPSFALDQPDAALDEARLAAIKAARARADLYARAAGLHVARILSIAEQNFEAPQPMRANMVIVTARRKTPVAAGEVGLSVTVSMQFELAPGL